MTDTGILEQKSTDSGIKAANNVFGVDLNPHLPPQLDRTVPAGVNIPKNTVEVVRPAQQTEKPQQLTGTPATKEDVKVVTRALDDHTFAMELVPFFAGQGATTLLNERMNQIINDKTITVEDKQRFLNYLRPLTMTAENKYLGVDINAKLKEAQEQRETDPVRAAFAFDYDMHIRKFNVSRYTEEIDRLKNNRKQLLLENPTSPHIKKIDDALEVNQTKLDAENQVLNGTKDKDGNVLKPGLVQLRSELRINKTTQNPQGEAISDTVVEFAKKLGGVTEVNEQNEWYVKSITDNPIKFIVDKFGQAAISKEKAKELRELLPSMKLLDGSEAAGLLREIKLKGPGFKIDNMQMFLGFITLLQYLQEKLVEMENKRR